MRATYSPEDNKLRLYPDSRLPKELYERVKKAGFSWAPRQGLFVAPMWTPEREDLLEELCGGVQDEDTTLAERAEERAERFDAHSGNRLADAHAAKAAVDRVAERFDGGQPILVGHHSERKARKDAERIENGMRRAVKLWETSKYWEDRAASAIAHAKYKELPAVRYRRIKALEADLRRVQSSYTPADNPPDIRTQTEADGTPYQVVWCGQGRGGHWVRLANLEKIKAGYARWEAHYRNRIAYERAMLGEQGGIKADRFDLQLGGRVLASGVWLTVTKLNKKGGAVVSVSTNNRSWPRVVPVETIKDYTPPAEGAAEQVKAATKLPPLCNYPATGIEQQQRGYGEPVPKDADTITQAEWDRCHADYKTTRIIEATAEHGRHRVRYMMRRGGLYPVFVSDARRKDPPAPEKAAEPTPVIPPPEHDLPTLQREAARAAEFRAKMAAEDASEFARLKDAAKAGVQVVSAPQLFPTPVEVARRVYELADMPPGAEVLEPSAGTGAMLDGFRWLPFPSRLAMVEVNRRLASALRERFPNAQVHCGDFLEMGAEQLGTFDRVVMNPPFENASDVAHVLHARRLLKPGGRLVSVVANGPRQRAKLEPIASAWVDLPAGSFAESGTGVNTAIVVIDGPDAG